MSLLLLSLINGFSEDIPALWAGLAGWGAGALLAKRLQGVMRIQVMIMLTLGVLGLVWGLVSFWLFTIKALTDKDYPHSPQTPNS